MPRIKRKSSGLGAKKASSAPIVIDLLDDDETALPNDAPLNEPAPAMPEAPIEEEDVKPKPVSKPAKKTAKKSARGKAPTPPVEQEPASMPVEPTTPQEIAMPKALRRSVTLPISQMRSRTSTSLKQSAKSPEPAEAETPAEEEPEPAKVTKPTKAIPKKSSTPIPEPEKPEIAMDVSFERQTTLPLSSQSSILSTATKPATFKFTPISTSLSSRMSSLPSLDTSTDGAYMRSSGSSSLFRFRDSIDVDLVKNTSTGEEMDHLLDGEGIEAPKMTRGHASSLRESLTEAIHLDEDSEEEDFQYALAAGRLAKKHCGPGHVASTPSHSTQSQISPTKSPNGSASASKAPKKAGKKTAAPRPTFNADLLLDEILGTSRPPATVAPLTTVQSTAQSAALMARSYLQSATRMADNSASSPASRVSPPPRLSSTPTLSFNVLLKIGSRSIEAPTTKTATIASFLDQIHDKLPILLPTEQFFIKFDGIPLSATATMDNSLVASGDTLVLAVRRDGKEVPNSFDAMDEDDSSVVDNANKISLTARFSDGKTVKYRISKDEPLSKLRDAAAKRLGVDPSTVKVKFDGVTLKPNLSSNELEEPLEEDDMVDILVKHK